MECREAIDRLITLDQGESPDQNLVHHLESCEKCRREWHRFTSALESLRHVAPAGADNDAPLDSSRHIDRIMESVVWRLPATSTLETSEANRDYTPGLQMRNWVLGGVALLFGIGMTPYIASAREFRGVGGVGVATAVALGVIVTVYASVFVRANLQQLTRFVRRFTG
ncbi:MAG: hypothetical protein EA426_05405 [Spirochaetaceae bacterium]|nr:MAG: hypothetical protein EA426_05405 [Spirochaetaceae bacterium]